MLLNRFETMAVNNPTRTAVQKHFEARRLLRMGGTMNGGVALEVGSGRGVVAEIILDRFDCDRFREALIEQGFQMIETRALGRDFAFFVADRPAPGDARA